MEKFSLLHFLKSPVKDAYPPAEKTPAPADSKEDKSEALSLFFKNHEKRKNDILKNRK